MDEHCELKRLRGQLTQEIYLFLSALHVKNISLHVKSINVGERSLSQPPK